jgi:hypothetical protein
LAATSKACTCGAHWGPARPVVLPARHWAAWWGLWI